MTETRGQAQRNTDEERRHPSLPMVMAGASVSTVTGLKAASQKKKQRYK